MDPESLDSRAVLSQGGLLNEVISDFTAREAQITMAEAIQETIRLQGELIVEAGTGTGKTFAYLVPALLAGKKTIISTGTKNLQDQLFLKDIPLIKQVFKDPFKIVLLKGRSNYLCLHRLDRSRDEGRFVSRQLVSELLAIADWATYTKTGDTAELDSLSEDSMIWPHVTSTVDNCLGQDCPVYKDCFVVKARQEAMSADMVIVNHHLFFADMALQEEGFGELLPGAEVVIFDEAHLLPDTASYFFSTVMTSRQIAELARDTESEILLSASDMKVIQDECAYLERAIQNLRASLGTDLKSYPWPSDPSSVTKEQINNIKESLRELESLLKEAGTRSKGLENCWKRAHDLIDRFDKLTQTAPLDVVHWYELHSQSFTIHQTPLIVAEFFKRFMSEKKRAWIFTSATLTVKKSFRLFVETMGLDSAMQIQLKSPFDYQKQALLYAPRGLPDVHAPFYTETMMEAVIPVLEMTGGRAFILFTSYRAMELAHQFLQNRLNFPLLKQGTKPKRQLIEEFVAAGNAVLLATSSFWYGVDVRGDALSLVVIDKLPFASPDDPILQAKVKLFKREGIDAFQYFQLPQAVLTLKQGAGRLIRDVNDRGILMICDPRLVGNRYGEVFLQSLPNMSRTRDLEKVKAFLENTSVIPAEARE